MAERFLAARSPLHYTRFDQVNQLVGASEADPERGFMARTMALCSLPRSHSGNFPRAFVLSGTRISEQDEAYDADEDG